MAKTEAINEEQMMEIFRMLDGYSKGNVEFKTFGSGSITAPSNAQQNIQVAPQAAAAKSRNPTNTVDPRKALNMAPGILGLAAMQTGDQSLGQLASIAGLAKAISQPNASIQSVAPSFLGTVGNLTGEAGLGKIAGALSLANNGPTAGNMIGLMSMLNPAFGYLGIANGMLGNPIGQISTALSNTWGNQNSMNALNNVGISDSEQSYNAANNWQGDKDTEGMDNLANSFGNWGGNYGGANSSSGSDGGDSDGGNTNSNSGARSGVGDL